jgi:hypothetical protein
MMRYISEQRVFLYVTYVKYGENFYLNFVMKEFPAHKQVTIWQITLEQRDSQQTRNKNINF